MHDIADRLKFLFCVAIVSFGLNTGLFWLFESGEINSEVVNFFDVVWWWIVTSSTLGYGDIVPATWQGRLVSMLAIVSGFFIYTNLVAIIAESTHSFLQRKSLGTARVDAEDHIVICEYTAVADELIQSIEKWDKYRGRAVVIVSDLVSRNPYPEHYFVRGVPLNPAVLKQAAIQKAAYVFIFANLRFADPDVKTIHIASRVRALNPGALVYVEILDPGNELLDFAPDNLIKLNSRDLIISVLRDRVLDVDLLKDQATDKRQK